MKKLRLLLGDQLNYKHSWFNNYEENTLYCFFEMQQETNYVKHHIQKIVGFFAAMRSFADYLKRNHHQVIYYKISDKQNTQNLTENLSKLIRENNIQLFEYQEPDEYRLDHQLKEFCAILAIQSNCFSTEHFYTTRTELKTFFKGKKQFLMENFYRYMRKKHQLLMVNNEPLGGKWNYDHSNRNKWKEETLVPLAKSFDTDVTEIVEEIKSQNIHFFGAVNSKYFEYPINRTQSLEQLDYFCKNLLLYFGDYQDAMHSNQLFLYHSKISFALNTKMISPKEVINKVVAYYENHQNEIDISQVEGFVRQIIGWREYMRGMYWMLMPTYKEENFFENQNPLPNFFWTGKTKMNCLKNTINNSLQNSYAHHIQRLMVTGNFALLAQIHPSQVDAWYLGIYIDAIEWVQLPNTRGMSQYADGGKIATKPYISSGSYIQKMSNYCDSCTYNYKEKTGNNACPFNSLYWNFLNDKRALLQNNFRMKMMYSILDKMPHQQKVAIKEKAAHILNNINDY